MEISYLKPNETHHIGAKMSDKVIQPEEESLILTALRRAYSKSPFWQNRMCELGIKEGDFVPGFPFYQMPLISKSDLLEDQRLNPPLGNLLAVPPDKVRRIHKTSGTSATPLFIALTEQDICDTYVASERAFHHVGVGKGKRIIHCLNFNMWSGGVTDYIPIERLGATGIPFGVGNTALLLNTIRALSINAISSTPSYMFTLRDRCRSELDIDPRDLGLRYGYFGGEGLLQIPGVRDEIEQTFGMTAIDANYGMSEVLSIIAGEGAERNGLVNHTHGILYTEIVDANGNPVPITEGAQGELVFSSLRREGQPLFRYRTNDLVEIIWAETEQDGLLRMRFRVKGRTDDMLVIKGVNFFPQSLLSIISGFEPKISRFYRVIRPENGEPRELVVAMETYLPDGAERDKLAEDISHKVVALFQIRISIHWLPVETIPRDSNKTRFLVNSIEDISS